MVEVSLYELALVKDSRRANEAVQCLRNCNRWLHKRPTFVIVALAERLAEMRRDLA